MNRLEYYFFDTFRFSNTRHQIYIYLVVFPKIPYAHYTMYFIIKFALKN